MRCFLIHSLCLRMRKLGRICRETWTAEGFGVGPARARGTGGRVDRIAIAEARTRWRRRWHPGRCVRFGESPVGLERWAANPECETMEAGDADFCDNAQSSIGKGFAVPIRHASDGVAYSDVVQGLSPAVHGFPYVQASLSTGDDACDTSDVYPSDEIVTVNPEDDFNGESRRWRNCDGLDETGFETDVLRDYFHCGSCGNAIQEDGLWCTWDQCVNGAVDRSILAPQSCLIENECYPHAGFVEGNDCMRCDVTNSTTSWTRAPDGSDCSGRACYGASTCGGGTCNGGIPLLDRFELNNTLVTRASLWGPEGPQGRGFKDSDEWGANGTSTTVSDTTLFQGTGNDIDWFHYTIDDCVDRWGVQKCGREGEFYGTSDFGPQPRPRVRIVPPSGHALELCVWVQCAVGQGIDFKPKASDASQPMRTPTEGVGKNSFGRSITTHTVGEEDYMRLYSHCKLGTNYNETADIFEDFNLFCRSPTKEVFHLECVYVAATLARPVLWTAVVGGVSTLRILMAPSDPGYGIAYGVTEDRACGGAGAVAGAYSFAACWPLRTSRGMQYIHEVGPAPGYATRVVNRVRRINAGSDVDPRWLSAAVGHACGVHNRDDRHCE